ncbi:unnamed protein product [Prunus armeniaca]|uniref:Disease resistance protein At4g27190-like leucine-rich repeats domain-containing protein n=1 Tax=Prunus armeniaca TaxID=36596 RepID=A0A6J5WLD8_PRUAR|nr:unnamed protein product [Prunus armeniaca]
MAGEVVKDDPIKSCKCSKIMYYFRGMERCLEALQSFDQKGLTEKAYLAIEWSYNRLDREELQPLFLLCGVIAGGSCSILLSDLLKYDMGLGLVKNVDTVEEARNALHSLAKKLKDSCLLLDSYDDRKVRMHELVRDVAIWIASKDKHAFSRAYGDEIPRLPEVPWVCPKLRFFLLANHNVDDSLEIPGNYFEGMKELKVLDVTRLRIPSLPPSLQSLTNLQTLCLDHCVLVDIALVGQLTNLKILSLLNSKVKELPKEIGQLTRLQLLDLRYCSELVLISPGVISSLTSLEDLRMGSFKEWEEIYIPDAKLLPANMFSDTRLESSAFSKATIFDFAESAKAYWFLLQGSRAAVTTKAEEIISENEISGPTKLFMKGEVLIPNLTSLVVDGCGGLRFLFSSSMARSLVQLKNLTISNCQIMEEIVPTYESSEEDTDHNMFSQLQDLKLEYLPNLTRFCSARRSINFIP